MLVEAAFWSPSVAKISCWIVECTWGTMMTGVSQISPISLKTDA
uniref:Uncharacterized protein n=1 Tax=Anguilla anguilla TaxID=7936 RepID=A0A0E9R1D3_ANGAN